jgi:hypothetical protein
MVKNMRYVPGVLAFLALSVFAVGVAQGDYIYVKDVTMHLSEGNATFKINYSLEALTRFYVLALGCSFIEPDLLSLFGNYSDARLLKADADGASIQVIGAGKYNNGYYLFESMPLGTKNEPLKEGISRFTVVYPSGRARTFYNVTSTQSVFYDSRAFFNLSTNS